jgi:hypothetical protein
MANEEKPGALKGILGGIVFTLVLIIIVPALCEHFISGFIEDIIGDNELLGYSSRVLVSFVMWVIIIGFTILLGGGKILKRYGIFGILGLVVAYWLLGDVTDAIIPIIMLILVTGLMFLINKARGKNKK